MSGLRHQPAPVRESAGVPGPRVKVHSFRTGPGVGSPSQLSVLLSPPQKREHCVLKGNWTMAWSRPGWNLVQPLTTVGSSLPSSLSKHASQMQMTVSTRKAGNKTSETDKDENISLEGRDPANQGCGEGGQPLSLSPFHPRAQVPAASGQAAEPLPSCPLAGCEHVLHQGLQGLQRLRAPLPGWLCPSCRVHAGVTMTAGLCLLP